MKYNPNIHHRKSIRLKGYDYGQEGLYFITICCQDRAHLFGEIINGEMILNEFGQIAFAEWKNTEQIRDNCHIYESIIMPNHIHGIIEITHKKGGDKEIGAFQSPSQTIGAIIRGFKIATIKRIKEYIQKGTGELQFAPTEKEKDTEIGTGELRFSPTEKEKDTEIGTGELQFSPTEKERDTEIGTGELQFAPTEKIKALDFKLWQRNYYEHIIRDQNEYDRISEYIINNPQKWETDKLK